MTFTENEIRTISAVFNELCKRPYDELNAYLGSITIKEMRELSNKLEYRDYCSRHNIAYEDMTDEDFEDAYFEKSYELDLAREVAFAEIYD